MRGRLCLAIVAIATLAMLTGCGRTPTTPASTAASSSTPSAPVSAPAGPEVAPPPLFGTDMTGPDAGWGLAHLAGALAVVRTSDGGASWSRAAGFAFGFFPPFVFGTALAATGDGHVWAAAETDTAARPEVVVMRSADAGAHVSATRFPVAVDGGVTLSFPDAEHGFLLATSTPATGSMDKAIYATADGGATWTGTFCTCASPPAPRALGIGGFPAGFTFRSPSEGWIGVENRNGATPLLYHTVDGGHTWPLQDLATPPGFGYSRTYAPAFFGSDRRDGVLFVTFRDPGGVGGGTVVPYLTQDGGASWTGEPPLVRGGGGLMWGADRSGDVLVLTHGQVYRSKDGGVHWSAGSGPSGLVDGDPYSLSVVGGQAWLLVRTGRGTSELWHSPGGGPWTRVAFALPG